MTIIDPALLDSLEKDYFDDPRVLVLVTLFRCAQSKSPVVAQVSSALTSAIEEWKQLGGGGEIIRNEPPPEA